MSLEYWQTNLSTWGLLSMGEAKRRKQLDPYFGQSDLKAVFLDENSQEYQDLLQDVMVQQICQPMTPFYLLKASSMSRGWVVYCIGLPLLVDGKFMDSTLYPVLEREDPARAWLEKYQQQLQRMVFQRAISDFR